MKTITGILLGILLISCVYAINITAGESYSFLLSEPYSYYEVTGNQTELDLDIQQNEKNVTIYFGKYIKSDNFTIIFYNWKDEVIYSSGGGGSCSYDKDFDWNCSEWSICENEIQTRICKEYNNCHNTYKKPNETQFCIEPSKINDTVDIDIDIDEPELYSLDKVESHLKDIGAEVIVSYETKNGYHVITKPFNPNLFNSDFGEVKKDALLLLDY